MLRQAGAKSRRTKDWKPEIYRSLRRVHLVLGMRPAVATALATESAGMQRALDMRVGRRPLSASAVMRELKWRSEIVGRGRLQPRDPEEALPLYLAAIGRIVKFATRQQQLGARIEARNRHLNEMRDQELVLGAARRVVTQRS